MLGAGNARSSKPTFIAYVDESGDEGFKFGSGASDWFVLSAVILRTSEELTAVRLVDDIRVALGRPPKKPLHFRDMRHEHRLPYVDRIASAALRSVSILACKHDLDRTIFSQEYRLYFYLTKFLLERISWYCRDSYAASDSGDGSVEIVFSNRASMSYAKLRLYLELLKAQGKAYANCSIDWNVVRSDQILSLTHGKRMGLQIADAVASGFFYGVEASQYGHVEDRYARMLRPTVYGQGVGANAVFGYGLKFWPRKRGLAVQMDPRLSWLETYR